jgi:NAD(P)-dependent dehydrogenase (short-subunit alcohol dehydrogenase family)
MCGRRKSVRTSGRLSNWADAKRIAAAASDRFGGIDILCANAGIFPAAKLDDLTPEGWDDVQVSSTYVRQTAPYAALFIFDHYQPPSYQRIRKIFGVGDWTGQVQNCRMHY